MTEVAARPSVPEVPSSKMQFQRADTAQMPSCQTQMAPADQRNQGKVLTKMSKSPARAQSENYLMLARSIYSPVRESIFKRSPSATCNGTCTT